MKLALSRVFVAVAAVASFADAPTASAQTTGAQLYAQRCATCHDKDVPRAPRRDALRQMSPEAILGALQAGIMGP